ncbi:hypothetical protein ACOMHN_038909 [Nucella lapillus]
MKLPLMKMARLDVAKIVILLLGFQYLGHNWQLTGSGVKGEFVIPNVSKKAFKQLADINIGVLVAMTTQHSTTTRADMYTYPQVVAYAVHLVNTYKPLPGGQKLGFVILDTRGDPSLAAVQSLAFLPKKQCSKNRHLGDQQKIYDTVAVLQSLNSEESKASAQILGPATIPHISSQASSDEFSDFDQFPYFSRVVPAYRHESKLVIDILKEHGWTYVSVLYEKGSYGKFAFLQADEVAQQLVGQGNKATVVIVLLQYKEAILMFSAIQRLNLSEPFVFILAESVGPQLPERTPMAKVLADAIVLEIVPVPVPEFNDWFKKLTPVSIAGAILLVETEWKRFTQIGSKPAVEHTCLFPRISMVTFLIYTLTLVALSATLALKSHKLVADKESDFLSAILCTTIIIIVCFVPAFYVANRQRFRMFILTMAILFNHTACLVCLFLAKIYDLVYEHHVTFRVEPTKDDSREDSSFDAFSASASIKHYFSSRIYKDAN